ncbi:hypothetical protein GWI33_014718, partial [Rhynchophorus ferrugineus]
APPIGLSRTWWDIPGPRPSAFSEKSFPDVPEGSSRKFQCAVEKIVPAIYLTHRNEQDVKRQSVGSSTIRLSFVEGKSVKKPHNSSEIETGHHKRN